MARAEMLLERMRGLPPEMRLSQVQVVLDYLGWTLDRTQGSHFIYVREGDVPLSIPRHGGYVKRVYLKQILARQ